MTRCINPKGRHWTVEEAVFAMTNYGPMPIYQIAAKLNRTYASTQSFITRFPWWHLREEALKAIGGQK